MGDTNRFDRREFLRLAGMAGIGVVGAACAPAAAPTPTPTKAAATAAPAAATPTAAAKPAALKPEEVRAQLYEAAKKEGQVLIYSTGTSADMNVYRQAFSKTYPGIEIKEYMGTGEQITEKLLTEAKAGKAQADVYKPDLEMIVVARKEGVLEKYLPPESVNFPPETIDPENFYTLNDSTIFCMVYNTQLVPAANVPKKLEDLLDPVFKGKLGLEAVDSFWFAQIIANGGRDWAVDYLKKYAAQQPKFIKGRTALADTVTSGEIWAAPDVNQHRIVDLKKKGAPVEWVVDARGGGAPVGPCLVKGAPHPNAAKLLIDWFLTTEGQDASFKGLSRFPLRKGYSFPPELQQTKVIMPTMKLFDDYAAVTKLFKEIMGLL